MTAVFNIRFLTSILITLPVLLEINALPLQAENGLYHPIPLTLNTEINDNLTAQDIPTGEGGFSRDYVVNLSAGDQVAIDLKSDEFDTMIMLIAADGSTVGSNDDGPDGGTSSLLFARITETGKYIVRVRTFGVTGGGRFSLQVTRLRPAS